MGMSANFTVRQCLLRRPDFTGRFRDLFHGCLAESGSHWLSVYPALDPAINPALHRQIEPRPSKSERAGRTNNPMPFDLVSAKES
jgi:hypothetical protein